MHLPRLRMLAALGALAMVAPVKVAQAEPEGPPQAPRPETWKQRERRLRAQYERTR
jgi:hypothetical protein